MGNRPQQKYMQRFIYMAYLKGAGIILFLALLLYIAWTDYKIKRIPDKYTAALLLWGIIWARLNSRPYCSGSKTVPMENTLMSRP
jgi:Flp pilus assembly protein protease CpaA